MSKIKLIIFDFDGVIIDSEHLYNNANYISLKKAGIKINKKELHSKFIGMDFKSMLNILKNDYGRNRIEIYKNKIQTEIYKQLKNKLCIIPYIKNFLETTKIPYYIGSNAKLKWIKFKIKILKLEYLFNNNLVSVDCVNFPKPAPDIFKLAADRAGVKYNKCAVIEDGIYGIKAAKSLNMIPIGFTGQTLFIKNHDQKLINAGAILSFNCMSKLPNIISKISKYYF